MRNRITIFLIMCLSTLLVACSVNKDGQDDEQKLTQHQKAWIADIDGPLRDGLAKAAGVNEFVSDEERNARLDTLIQLIQSEDWNDDYITYYIKELISDIHVAHINFNATTEYKTDDYRKSYVMAGKWFEDGFYVFATLEEYKDCIGSKIVAINDIGIEEVLSRYDRLFSNETESYLKYCFEEHSKQGFLKSELEYLGIAEVGTNQVIFTLEKDGRRFEQCVDAVDIAGGQELSITDIYSDIETLPYGDEIYYSKGQPPFCYEIDKEHKTLYFQYNMCYDATYMDELSEYLCFDEFMDQMIQDMKQNEADINCFVIDLRNNLGGSELLWNAAIEKHGDYLKQYPIKILIGKVTFSAAVDVIDRSLYALDNVTLYGEETGLAVHNYTECENISLENTGCELSITNHKDDSYVLEKRAENIYAGVLPDIEVKQAFEDYLNGVDDVYLKAVSD